MDKMRMESVDMTEKNIDRIADLFPNCITEAVDEEHSTPDHKFYKKVVNFDMLRQMLSGDVLEGDEAYEFTWVGKKAAIVEANRPIRKTLRPCKEESLDWDKTENLYIEGDNLEVLKLLQESYLGKVKMIYIDPPYNTGNDFIYNDDFKISIEEYVEEQGEFDDDGNRMFKNTETNGRFHSDWCSMIYSRLMLARNLLSDEGMIFISIDDKEVDNIKKICVEIFGESNFVGNMIWQSRTSISNDDEVSTNHNHTLIFSKSRAKLQFGGELIDINEYSNPDNDVRGPWKLVPIDANHTGGATVFPIKNPKTGVEYYPPNGRVWCYNAKTVEDLMKDGRIKFGLTDESSPKRKLYYNERIKKGDKKTPSSIILDAGTTKDGTTSIMKLFDGKKVFDYPKSVEFMKKLVRYGTYDGEGIILDFFSGSSTTAQAVIELNVEDNGNRKYMMVQVPQNLEDSLQTSKNKETIINAIDMCEEKGVKHTICEVGKERIRRAGRKIVEENKDKEEIENLDIGFRVLKLDESNMNDVYYSPAEYSQDLLLMLESNVKSDRNDLDLLFGCLLEWGLPLSLPYSSEQIDGCTVHNYNDGDLIACFDKDVPDSVIKEIAKRQPLRAVFRDSSFANSPSKINVGEIFKLMAPDTRVKVI